MTQDDPLATLRARVGRTLKGFTTDFPANADTWLWDSSAVSRDDIPLPELVLFLLRNVLECEWSGTGEKVRWSVYASVSGMPIAFEYRKFGLVIAYQKEAPPDFKRVVGQVRAALRNLEEALQPIAQRQISEGNVTIANHYSEFDTRYRFFRGLADKAFMTAKRPSKKKKDGPFDLAGPLNKRIKAEREGFFHSAAMIDAYFSRLEHILLLLRAFVAPPLAAGGLEQLLRAGWDEKLKAIVNITGDRKMELALGRLRALKERIRNPFAHGGVENDGGSLFFHMPEIGAIPANFSRFKDSVRFNFIPVEKEDHLSACSLFDEIDDVLQTGGLAAPYRFLDAGVDPSFDAGSMSEYLAAIQAGTEAVEEYLTAWGEDWTRHANMDY